MILKIKQSKVFILKLYYSQTDKQINKRTGGRAHTSETINRDYNRQADRQTDRPQRQRQSDRRAQTCHTQSPTDRQDRPTWRQGLYRDRETQTDTQVLHTESGRQINSTKDHLRQTDRQTEQDRSKDTQTCTQYYTNTVQQTHLYKDIQQ